MVEGYKPPKNKGVSSISKENDIDQYDPLFLHINDTNGVPIIGFKLEDVFMRQVFSKIDKVVWDELEETYSKQDASDSLVDLPDCVYENSEKLKKHNQLLKLMQFLMGLDEVYAPIRSIILTTDPIPDVKGAFATLSRDESHRSTQSNNVSKISGSSNSATPSTKDQSSGSSNTFTDDQFKRLMALINEKSGSSNIPANVADVSKLSMTVGHPNGTKAIVTHIGSLRLTDKITINDVLVVPDYQVSLLYVHKLNKDNKFRTIFDEDICIIQDFVLKT
ncbi:hypothetical protein Tco_0185830 [Tanacetum coccineum]